MILEVYVDYILLTRSDTTGIMETKEYLRRQFVTKDTSSWIEFAYDKDKMVLLQRKYVVDLLQEIGLLGCKPETTRVDQNPHFWDCSSKLLRMLDGTGNLLGS